ncbi:Xanthine/uracil permease [Basidiobolus meristosporus CBS 931.73]|uniref:Xanthine/uracil permease n=1 Tax=Basidiobolus meristosporus CBS 931.73 TaxID=1314790 RepID=A0A1Y1XI55_9FUNG|nr:Xanthine/uracil permease [Basidiobolus meristosporus CBS 931.73]|eukprot:ORX85439.1 Xanthine/uracil permease [Basidiobolus meristosporus CBS 931.73]
MAPKLVRVFSEGSWWSRMNDYFPKFVMVKGGEIAPDERPPWLQLGLLGLQHVLAMFGSTVFAPLVCGFDSNTAIFCSGIGTILFFFITGGRVPSYLGSSFAFIGVVTAATGYQYSPGAGLNQHIPLAQGGIIIAGAVYAVVAVIVLLVGYRWVEFLMPPVVTGAVVMSIGLNLAGTAVHQAAATSFDAWMAFTTVLAVAFFSVYGPGITRRVPILLGAIVGYVIDLICGYAGAGPKIDYTEVGSAKWIGLPMFHTPAFDAHAISLITPVVIILIAENIGHIKAVSAMTGRNLEQYIGRAFMGDAIGTMVAGSLGSLGVTTYAENIGVMAVTKIFSTLVFVTAASVAVLIGFLPKFGAVIHTIPAGVFGGLSIVLFGLIAVSGARIWIENQIDFTNPRNLLTGGIAVLLGTGMTGDLKVTFGPIAFDGIGVSTISAVILYQVLRGYPQRSAPSPNSSEVNVVSGDEALEKLEHSAEYQLYDLHHNVAARHYRVD